MEDWKITISGDFGTRTFLTKAKSLKSALRHLIDNSNDFNMIKNEKKAKLKIECLK